MSFEEDIQNWVVIDNNVKELNERLKELRNNKNELSEKLLEYASDNNLTHKIIEITDGNLKFQTRKQPSALTFTFIEKCLSDCISNEDHVKQILHYIKEKRESKYINELKRTYKN